MISFLWRNRARYAFGSRLWLRAWAKRILTSYTISQVALRTTMFRWRGARIDRSAFLSKVDIRGNLTKFSLGELSFVGRAKIQVHDSVQIGARVCINDGVQIFTATHLVNSPDWQPITRPVTIEDFAWICSSAVILPGVRIGRGAVIGAGTVVAKDVPAGAVAIGNPCVIRQERRPQDLNYSPVSFLAGVRAWICDETTNSK
jgi:acetyltransferase-like isoleucine patch superfamily enzyme